MTTNDMSINTVSDLSEVVIETVAQAEAVSLRIQQLKKEMASLHRQIFTDGEFRRSMQTLGQWEEWAVNAKQRSRELKRERAILQVAHTAWIERKKTQKSAKQRTRERIDTPDGITALLREARLAIEAWNQKHGDEDWNDKDREICGSLHFLEKRLRGDKTLDGWLSPQEASKLRQDHAQAAAKLRLEIARLEQEVRTLQAARSVQWRILEELWGMQADELEEWRLNLGYTHRINLKPDTRRRILAALNGIDEATK